jgi:predicted ribosome quality control (RQC) complex YloA/Tae2 family protein
MKSIEIQGILCKIGGNAIENWELLEKANENNLLFHLTSFPSCYVIYESVNGDDINFEIIRECAILCKNNTKYRNLKNIKVDYTTCNNIIKGDKIGEIIYKKNKKVKKIII